MQRSEVRIKACVAYQTTTGTRPELPDALLARSDLRRLIEGKIDELPLPPRIVFILRALEEMSVSETAAALGIPEATVRTRFFRASMQLSATLGPEAGPGLGAAFSFAGVCCDRIVGHVLAVIASGSGSLESGLPVSDSVSAGAGMDMMTPACRAWVTS
jgi:hypothetical protein